MNHGLYFTPEVNLLRLDANTVISQDFAQRETPSRSRKCKKSLKKLAKGPAFSLMSFWEEINHD